MMLRLFLGVFIVANLFVLVICTEQEEACSTTPSSTSTTSCSSSTTSNSPKVCPKHERYSECIQTECRALKCNEKDQPIPCPIIDDPRCCIKGCVCKKNFLRNKNGKCVPENQCEKTEVCPKHERYSECIQAECRALNCTQKDQPIPCPRIDPRYCIKGCVCKEQFLRNKNGKCVPENQCEKTEVCPKHERYSECIQAECRALNCTQKDQPIPCPRIDPRYCIKGCVCKEQFLRNKNGKCVPENQCEKTEVCPKHERYSECIQAECRALNCNEKDQPIRCVRIDPRYCIKGCVCEEKFLRNNNGICVPENQCEKTNICPVNEEYVPCIQGVCRALNCSQKGQDVPCPNIPEEECDSGCICKENYLRNKNNICVPEDQCEPNTCPPNQEWSECIEGICRPQMCSQRGEPVPRPPIRIEDCTAGCVCKENHLKTDSGTCVPEDECEPGICPINREWSECIEALCRPENCSQKDMPIACPMIVEGYCSRGCVCQQNFLLNNNGVCVPEDQCEPRRCGINEEIRCVTSCPPERTCRNRGIEFYCKLPAEPCQYKCVCKDGYFRNAVGNCITNEECDKCPGAHEYFACDSACDNVCATIHEQNRTNCPIVNIVCNPMCYCEDGFARDDNGNCIPVEECKPRCTGQNEMYTDCKKSCPPETCLSLVAKFKCDSTECCRPGCVCKPGYLRQKLHSPCIPICECDELKNSPECRNATLYS